MDAHIEKADYTEAIIFEVNNDVSPNTVTINTMMIQFEAHNAILIHGLFKKYNIPQGI